MKKKDFKKLAMAGLTSGMLIAQAGTLQASDQNQHEVKLLAKGCSSCRHIADNEKTKTPLANPSSSDSTSKNPESENYGYHMMTEKELLMELNDEGTKTYNSLDAEGKAMALKMASQRCQGTNDCKGENACKTDHNDCAGKGACKGQSKCAFSDKNLAVKLAAKKMQEKRANSLNK